ncbi:hypothetical protein DVB69_01885 [Sporosarcina sp. BI001-red]|uniref:hypothetical protein n=1 Tax=Sporosarcina sp. BI001-red TaxID=2282866 RepID=UPI000E278057|nr:hypothetical protein [Sporosarcina sp. BI001-red]REB09584.1 hypothetical protein DVB69_01885 [Sporosarcina sp. BI001-red]
MGLFILGVLFVFAKFNLQFLDTDFLFYITNVIGYSLMYVGLRSLGREITAIRSIQPFVLVMIVHSIGFALLNGTGHSIKTISLSTGIGTIFALSLVTLAVAGMIMIFYIIQKLFLAIRNNEDEFTSYSNISSLEKFPALLLILLTITGILFFTLPAAAHVSMMLLLVAELFFILYFSTKVQTA